MIAGLPVSFQSFWFFLAAVAMTLLALLVLTARRRGHPGLPFLSAFFALFGMLCLALAAGQPVWHRPHRHTVGVMLDLSPSTRGALFRDPAQMKKRLQELIGDAPYRLFGFARNSRPLSADSPWREIPTTETRFYPSATDAVVLFSDCQFRIPASGPATFVVVDPGLENVSDARIDRAEIRGGSMSATVVNSGPPRIATFRAAGTPTTAPAETGKTIIARPLSPGARLATVGLNPADLWPENDYLQVFNAAPVASEKWWIGDNPPPTGWIHYAPDEFPLDPARLFSASVIVLNNVDFPSLGESAVDQIYNYVNDLDGSVFIVGGNHAYTMGNYGATDLERMSPLSMWPPHTIARWVILVDSSGSMAKSIGDITRFDRAARDVVRIIPYLAPNDLVNVGQFSDSVRWWYTQLPALRLTYYNIAEQFAAPRGATDLDDALNKIAEKIDRANLEDQISTKVLLLSDCDASISDPQSVIDSFKRANVSLNVIALAPGSALKSLQQITDATGGSIQQQPDPAKWFASMRAIAMPQSFFQTSRQIQYSAPAQSLATAKTTEWHRLWLKSSADSWAQSTDTDALPMAAQWRVGFGQVAATAFQPSIDQIAAMANLVAHPPHDHRFTIRWDLGKVIKVTVDAIDNGEFMDDLKLALVLPGGPDAAKWDIPQTAPGRYEVVMPASQRPTLMGVRGEHGFIDIISVASRYFPEFESLGNDHDAMRLMADRTGGQVVNPDNHNPIDFHWPQRDVDLAPLLCTAAAAFLAIAVIRWRIA